MTRRYVTKAVLRELERRLTERDLSVLCHVSELRFLSGVQLTRLCFRGGSDDANARASRRSLLRLTRLGLLRRLPRAVGGSGGSEVFVYCLDLGGQRLAMERGWQPKRGRR
jgi:Replication-relaxation